MYRNMAKYYDDIFPSTAKHRFLCQLLEDNGLAACHADAQDCENRSFADTPTNIPVNVHENLHVNVPAKSITTCTRRPKLLDIGCSNGRLAWMLAQSGYDVTAFDLSNAMIAAAKSLVELENQRKAETSAAEGGAQSKRDAGSISLIELDMLDVAERFPKETFDCAYCVGNTLVHLPDDESILQALHGFSLVLKPAGILVVQVLPYARILEKRPSQLPLIENDILRFERFYDYVDAVPETRIRFRTRLTIKETGIAMEGEEPLYPISQKHLEHLLRETKFSVCQVFGSFAGEALGEHSPALILVCKKQSKEAL